MNAQSTSVGEATKKALLMIQDQIYRAYKITENKKILSLSLSNLFEKLTNHMLKLP